jgi:hypothetical protein
MQRRKYLAAIGSLAAGGAAGIGTGAFTAQANRTARLEAVTDANAYLQMSPIGSTPVVKQQGGTITFDFGADSGHNGSGMNQNSVFEFTDVLRVKNAGKKDIWMGIYLEDLKNQVTFIDDADAYAHDDPDSPENDGQGLQLGDPYPPVITDSGNTNGNSPVDLTPGEEVDISFKFNVNGNGGTATNIPVYVLGVEKGGQYDQS